MIDVGELKNVDTIEELTEATIETWRTDQDSVELEITTLYELDTAVKKSVKMKPIDSDEELRTMNLLRDYRTLL